jgi:prepilin-type N-terminal cleavage/methylation domain-containing protein
MTRRAGFTLLEICLVVAISLMIALIAVPSIRGVVRAQRLHKSFEAFDSLALQAQSHSVNERRAYGIVWKKETVEMIPLEKVEEEPGEPLTLPIGKNEAYEVERPAAMGKDPEPVWTFWRSGVCEPVIVSYKGPDGTWTASYSALSAHGTLTDERAL